MVVPHQEEGYLWKLELGLLQDKFSGIAASQLPYRHSIPVTEQVGYTTVNSTEAK
jgi:hypothetical protein